ncbi:MAG: tyrosine-type recombinase/integrase [Phaeodactylibacter xiamenensis]|uniref:Tyr recombinase domain-containing protein n=1 Tax=Phaeodactylibacter xiamenensis TaxID=1524460 RepID=A0A098S2T5_9BACT|nr:tyrosine-type recombinase/integrase [Phaeodactylibacter xiamenensis]KGE85497.1 hypothetical protein IX84_28895 [Phaeodactylibacter xiamenensis]MCR9053274.1 site-specific integrase [bacterium]
MTIKAVLAYRKRQDGTKAIRIYVYHNGQKSYVPTDLNILEKDWNARRGEVKKTHPLSKAYNRKLNAIKHEIESGLLKGSSVRQLNKSTIDNDFLAYMAQYIKREQSLSEGTLRIYKSAHRHLSNYRVELGKEMLTPYDFTPAFIHEFRNYLYDLGCKDAGQLQILKKIKKVLRLGHTQGIHDADAWKEIKMPKEPTTNKIYLTQAEMDALYHLDLSHNPAVEKERDRFWLAYKFMMRYSDIASVNREMMVATKGKRFLVYISVKTKIKATVPIGENAFKLLEKYDWKLDFTSNQQANREIKRIVSMAGINQIVEQDGKSAPKSQFVTFHTARRSGATNAYLSGLSLKIIADVGGWKKFTTLQVYLRASQLVSATQAADHNFFKE